MMPRLLKIAILLCSAAGAGGCAAAARQGLVQTFADKCPSGWQFLYTDYDVSHSSERPMAVCRAQADTAVRLAGRSKP